MVPPMPDHTEIPRKKISYETIQTASVFVLLIALCVVSAIGSDTFFTWKNLVENLLTNAACTGIIALGMTFVMIAGGFDLSVASITAVCSVVMVLVLQHMAGAGLAAVVVAIGATLLAGAALGAGNGLLISYVGVNPFVVTLSTLLVFRGIGLVLTRGGQSIEVPPGLRDVVREFYWGRLAVFGDAHRVSVPILLFLGAFAILYCLLRYTRWGHYVYAVGGNEDASWLAGVNTARIKAATYTLSGLTCAAAAVIYTGMSNTAQAASYQGLEMVVIASVIVGGTPLGGGKGGLGFTLIGLLLLSVIENLLAQFNVTEEYRNIVRGMIILVVVAVDVAVRKRGAKGATT
jgi:ribose transport system permease protein